MKKLLISAAAAAAALVGAAQAAPIYADNIIWTNNGTVGSSNDRDNPDNGLGAPDDDFFALGLTDADGSNPGFAVFSFNGGQEFAAGTATAYEVTFGCPDSTTGSCSYPESAKVYYGTADIDFSSITNAMDFDTLAANNADFGYADEIFNGDAQTGASVMINAPFSYLVLVDSSVSNFPNGPSTDGFDVDAVGVNAVPVPGAALLMGSGLIAAAARRRRSK
ncbi:MAG: hypothetical protein AAFR65_04130 [Pseudomonadota bacterium]